MTATAQLAHRTECPHCQAEVLEAPTLGGVTVLMEVQEVRAREPCETCLSARQRRYRCWRCGAEPYAGREERWLGEDLTGILAVGIDEGGYAHVFIGATRARQPGEAVHRAHRCGVVLAA